MAFITKAGEQKIALQEGSELILDVTHFVLANIVGLGLEPADRIEAMPAVGDIVDTRAVSKKGYVNDSNVVYSLALDSTIGDYTFNWVGLKDVDGVLIAVIYLADPILKTKTNGGVDGNNLVRNFLMQYSGIQAITAINVPADTWQIDFTARLLGVDKRERLSNVDLYGVGMFVDSGWQVVRQGLTTTYDVSIGIGYVGGIRIDNAATQQSIIASPPTSLWLDVSLQGDITGVVEVVDIVISAAGLVDYTDGLGFEHYVFKIADIAADGAVTDTRTIKTVHESKADPHSQYLTAAEGNAAYDAKGGLAAHEAAADPHPQYSTEEDNTLLLGYIIALSNQLKTVGSVLKWQGIASGTTFTYQNIDGHAHWFSGIFKNPTLDALNSALTGTSYKTTWNNFLASPVLMYNEDGTLKLKHSLNAPYAIATDADFHPDLPACNILNFHNYTPGNVTVSFSITVYNYGDDSPQIRLLNNGAVVYTSGTAANATFTTFTGSFTVAAGTDANITMEGRYSLAGSGTDAFFLQGINYMRLSF